MDKQYIKNLFAASLNVSGRINRLDHLLRKLFLIILPAFITVVILIIMSVVANLVGEPIQMGASITIDFFFVLLFLIYAYIFGFLWNVASVLRLHDLGMDGRWCVLNFVIFIPLILMLFRIILPKPGELPLSYAIPLAIFILFNLYLIVMKGDEGTNVYGPSPAELATQEQDTKPNKTAKKKSQKSDRTFNPYAGDQGNQRPARATSATSGSGIRVVDKNYIKHSDRYRPKSAKKK